MSVALVGPNLPMKIGSGRVALWTALRELPVASDPGLGGPSPASIGNAVAWWDASSVGGLLDPSGKLIMGWASPVGSLPNNCEGGCALTPYSFETLVAFPVATPRLNGQ